MSNFPELEGFESSPALDTNGNGTDFLQREQAALGDDAAQFRSAHDQDLMGGDEQATFEQNFPELDGTPAASEMIAAPAEPYIPGAASAPVVSAESDMYGEQQLEPEAVREWRERWQLQIEKRDELSEKKKQETIAEAQRAIDDFYENYNRKRERSVAQAKKDQEAWLEEREKSLGGSTWEQVTKLVDLSEKGTKFGGRDTSKFRELLLSLRKDEKAPGAAY